MGKTKDYLDYLNAKVGISPAGSQEEFDCAQSLLQLFSSRGLDAQIQEFSAPALGMLPYGVIMVLLFLGVVIAGIGGVAPLLIGALIALASAAVLWARRSGNDVLARIGPRAHSQNVVALRRAQGSEETRERPIVILAHYDTQRLDPLSQPSVSSVRRPLALVASYATLVVVVCVCIQLLVFLPEPARRTFWVVGIIASLPMLVWGASLVAGRFMPYTTGAVDNKSSIAAMLGVLEYVTGGEVDLLPGSENQRDVESASPQEPVRDSVVVPSRHAEPITLRQTEEVSGIRHGERALRALGILPSTCEITFIEPQVNVVAADEPTKIEPDGHVEFSDEPVKCPADSPEVDVDAQVDAQLDAGAQVDAQLDAQVDQVSSPNQVTEIHEAIADEGNGDGTESTTSMELVRIAPEAGATHPLSLTKARARASIIEADSSPKQDPSAGDSEPEPRQRGPLGALSRFVGTVERLRHLENGQRTDEGPTTKTDTSGLSTMADEDANSAVEAARAERPVPETVDDPTWGISSFIPQRRQRPAAESPALPRSAALGEEPPSTGVPQQEARVEPTSQPTSELFASDHQEPATENTQRPELTNVARRATLFDLPDPLSTSAGPLDSTGSTNRTPAVPVVSVPSTSPRTQSVNTRPSAISSVPSPSTPNQQAVPKQIDDIKVVSIDTSQEDRKPKQPRQKRHRTGLFGHNREQQESMTEWLGVDEDFNAKDSGTNIGSWDNFDKDTHDHHKKDNDRTWKGGATRSTVPQPTDASGVDSSAEAPAAGGSASVSAESTSSQDQRPDVSSEQASQDGELRDAILSMGDDALSSHDIWFITTGASGLGHAGARQFVENHRSDLRGSFIVNLECVGAGSLTMLSREGFGVVRRADRRCAGLLSAIASDLHIRLSGEERAWADTEATPFMRKSLRAVTIMGLDGAGLPAYAHTQGDIPDNVDEVQVEDVSSLLLEMIRRS